MLYDYSQVTSLTEEQFLIARQRHDISKYVKSSQDDLRKIEAILDLREGVLSSEEYYLEKATCECGRGITFYDFVYTSIVDAGHPKSFVLHTLLGSKYVSNRARQIRCSSCNKIVPSRSYITPRYCCSGDPPD